MSDLRRATLTPFPGWQPVPPLARFSLQGDLQTLASRLEPVNIPVSRSACRAVAGGLCTALWLGPQEQLLLASEQNGTRVWETLLASLASVPHSLVDVSHRQVAFEITGPGTGVLLNAGCPLDLSDAAFPVGMCTRTLFEKSEIVLWRAGADRFHVEVWRSFAPYVTAVLAEVAREQR